LTSLIKIPGKFPGRVQATCYESLIWLVSASSSKINDFEKQMIECFDNLSENLKNLGRENRNLISVTVLLSNMSNKEIFDNLWSKWIGDNPSAWPQRSCFGVQLGKGLLVEITALAYKC